MKPNLSEVARTLQEVSKEIAAEERSLAMEQLGMISKEIETEQRNKSDMNELANAMGKDLHDTIKMPKQDTKDTFDENNFNRTNTITSRSSSNNRESKSTTRRSDNNGYNRDRERYLHLMKSHNNFNDTRRSYITNGTRSSEGSLIIVRPSVVAEKVIHSNSSTSNTFTLMNDAMSAAPASTLTETQEMLFRSMKDIVISKSSSSNSMKNKSKSRPKSASNIIDAKIQQQKRATKKIDMLTKPVYNEPTIAEKKVDRTLVYALYDDAKECTFKPQVKSNTNLQNNDSNNDAKSDGKDSIAVFLERQAVKEIDRWSKIDHKKGMSDYDAILDKKYCPLCGVVQTYDQVINKEKKCINCRVEYQPKLTWQTAIKQNREGKIKLQQRAIHNEEQQKKREQEDYVKSTERQVYDRDTGKIVTVSSINTTKWTKHVEQKFFDKLHNDFLRSEEKKKVVEKIQQVPHCDIHNYYNKDNNLSNSCPFKPLIKKKKNYDGNDNEDDNYEELEAAAQIEAFLKRYEEDLDARMEKHPEKFSKKKEVELLSFRP